MIKLWFTKILTWCSKIFVVLFILVAIAFLAISGALYKFLHHSVNQREIYIVTAETEPLVEDDHEKNLPKNWLELSDENNDLFMSNYKIKKQHFSLNNNDLRFSLNLLQKSLSAKSDNIVISPTSFYVTLTLLANGAEGKSLEELKKVLLLPDNTDMQKVNQNITAYLDNVAVNTQIHHSLWADGLTTEYKKTVELLTEIKSRPLYTNKINKWIAQKTAERIPDLIPNRRAKSWEIFMINAYSFPNSSTSPINNWEIPFNIMDTTIEPFYSLDSSKPDKVHMMRITAQNISYYEDEKMQAVKLYYFNGNNVQFFLPKEDLDFTTFIRELTPSDLEVKYTPQIVAINLPRFEISKIFDTTETAELLQKSRTDNVFEKLYQKEKLSATIFQIADIKIGERGQNLKKSTPQKSFWKDILYAFAYAGKNKESKEDNIEPYCCEEIPVETEIIFKANRPFVYMVNNGLFIGAYVKGDIQ